MRNGYSPSGSHEVELLLRFQITAPTTLAATRFSGEPPATSAIVRWNGPLGNYTPLLENVSPGIGAPANGDVLRAEIVGSVIKVYKNGALVAAGPEDSTYASGQPGIGFWPVDSSTPMKLGWTGFEAGESMRAAKLYTRSGDQAIRRSSAPRDK